MDAKIAIRVEYLRGTVAIRTHRQDEVDIQVIDDATHELIRAGKHDQLIAAAKCSAFGRELAALLDKYDIPRYAVEELN